ncbi:MAG: hypothetical protein MUE83_04880 [Tabrizicola sp.]|nr:hypothetical protein [Tabrizicola sp.]
MTANAVIGSAIEVTPLDSPVPGGGEAVKAADAAASGDTAAPQAAPQDGAVADPAKAAPEPAPKADLAATPVTPKSEMQLACEKRGGSWFQIGEGEKRACVRMTRDQGKRCERESQCESVCLARSGTCAPFKPMYGCNEILQDNGARVTLCLE